MMHEPTPEIETSPYDELRHGLIMGRWKSGERLAPQKLKEQLNCSGSILRDAMLQLSGEGLIVAEKNLGFRAVSHTPQAFKEAAHLRLVLEQEASRLALQRSDFDWELSLSAAYHKLAHVEKQMCRSMDVAKHAQRWTILDWEFHSTLIGGCGSEIMMRAYRATFDTFRMYSVAAFPDYGFRWEETMQEHQAIYDAAVNRDLGPCMAAVEAHIAVYQGDQMSDGTLIPPDAPSATAT